MIETVSNLREALEESPYDWLALGSAPHVAYATGYRSVGADLFRTHRMMALISADRTVLIGGASDGAAVLESATADEYVPFGTFYFESDCTQPGGRPAPESEFSGRNASFEEAVADAAARVGLTGRVGVDAGAAEVAASLHRNGVDTEDVTGWMQALRAVKLPAELALLKEAVRLAEAGIDAAIATAGVGATEIELATVVGSTMAQGGGVPGFMVVTSGPRSALSDARPTNRQLACGDLLRFDVGCTVQGYWSDIGRTAVVGEPDDAQASRYAAILAGEEAQLRAVRPGITAGDLFDVAVERVEQAGLKPYRRHHCGHAIGIEIYEQPIVSSGAATVLAPGMVLCVETPYYQIGWGGMMVEDALVVTETGCEVLSTSDRSLRVVGG